MSFEELHYDDRMSDFDALLWAIEEDPRLASTVVGVATFDKSVEPQLVRRRTDRLSRVIPRLRQRAVGNVVSLAPPRWEVDPDFSLDNHFSAVDCPGGGTLDDLLGLAATMTAEPFDRSRPLWEYVLASGLADGGCALIMKAHHAIADGLGMMMMQAETFDFEPDAEPKELPDEPEAAPLGVNERLQHGVNYEVGRAKSAGREFLSTALKLMANPSGAAEQTIDLVGSTVRNVQTVSPLSPLMTDRSSGVRMQGLTLDLGQLKAAGKRHGTRMNAVFVAGVADGIRRYHEFHDTPADRIRMGMPVNMRGEHGTDVGNFFAPVRFELPLDIGGPTETAQVIEALVASHRSEPALSMLAPAAAFASKLPAPVAAALFGRLLHGSDVLTSNIPGSPLPMFMDGARMVAQYPFGPLTTAAVNVTLLSYLDAANLGVSSNPAAVPDPDVLLECLDLGFDWVTQRR